MQGQLRHENLEMTIYTECGHCHQPLAIEIDSALSYRVLTPGAEPVIVTPTVNFEKLKDPSIIDAF